MKQPHELGAGEAAGMIRDGHLSSEMLVQSCLERIAERDPAIKAWVALNSETALEQARACDRVIKPRALLHGVPIGIKDVIDTADFITAHGSPVYQGNRPETDAACVAMLKRAGAVILGKTATAEFASHAGGPGGDTGVLDGAYGLAITALDYLADEGLRGDVAAEFAAAGGVVDVESLDR